MVVVVGEGKVEGWMKYRFSSSRFFFFFSPFWVVYKVASQAFFFGFERTELVQVPSVGFFPFPWIIPLFMSFIYGATSCGASPAGRVQNRVLIGFGCG